jgi:hypothetical protein
MGGSVSSGCRVAPAGLLKLCMAVVLKCLGPVALEETLDG